jgi:hypothetical protein
VIEVYGKTFLSILGVITNLLILLILRNGKLKKSFGNIMYSHIFFNSIFNLIYCIFNGFSLINICVFPKSSFCSIYFKTNVAQYFKIVFVLFLGNSIRLCSNFSFIFLSLSRFYVSTSSKSKIFLKFEKLNLKIFYSIMLSISSLWSLFKLFENKLNESYSTYEFNFPYNRYDSRYCQNLKSDLKFLATGCKMFPILNLINNIINDVLFVIISFVIDICMLRFVNKNYIHKKEVSQDQKHIKEALAVKIKVKQLIITNGILYFFSHMPQFWSTLLLIVFKKELRYFCFNYYSCTDINQLFEVFGLISISLQFFVYKHFDTNFIESLESLKQKISNLYFKK